MAQIGGEKRNYHHFWKRKAALMNQYASHDQGGFSFKKGPEKNKKVSKISDDIEHKEFYFSTRRNDSVNDIIQTPIRKYFILQLIR